MSSTYPNRYPGQGGLRVYWHLPKVPTQASGGKEMPYCSILDRLQARPSPITRNMNNNDSLGQNY